MTSLAPSSSVAFPSPPALAHTLNSRGELGMFVNPYGCSCQTCVDYVAERSSPAPAAEASVALGRSGSFSGLALGPSPANHVWTGSEWVHQDSEYGRSLFPPPPPVSLTRSSTGFVEGWGGEERPAPSLRSITGLGYAVAESEEEADGAASAAGGPYNRAALPGLGPCSAEEESVLVRLSSLRFTLKGRQDAIYSEAYRSHDEAAAQDAEWEELDSKITAIETLLRAFGVIIRDA